MKPAIVCDNYKLAKFRKELAKIGITDFRESPFTSRTTVIAFEIPDERIPEITKLCKEVELSFKRQN